MTRQGLVSMRRRRLGRELRALREEAGLRIECVADRLDFSPSKISRIETGHSGVTAQAVTSLLAVYAASEAKADQVTRLARRARQKDWWHLYGAALTSTLIEAEAEAARILAYEAQVMPGLLQTEAYARLVIRAARPDITDEQLDVRVEIRTKRQRWLLDEDPVDYRVILDEASFARTANHPTIMRGQLDRMIDMAGRRNVTVQVLPLSAGMHAAMDGTFAILDFDDRTNPNVVFTENAAGGLFLERQPDVERYLSIFERLRARALSPDASLDDLRARRAALSP